MAKGKSLSRTDFLKEVADRAKAHRRDVEHVWEHAVAVIRDSVKTGQDVSIKGFGKFRQRVTAARKAGLRRDPFTGEMRNFPAKPERRTPRFAPAKQFKEYVAGQLRSMPLAPTKPMALGAGSPAKASARKAAPKKAAPKRKPAAKKTARKPAKRRR